MFTSDEVCIGVALQEQYATKLDVLVCTLEGIDARASTLCWDTQYRPAHDYQITLVDGARCWRGYIRPASSEYGAPVLFVRKKSGELRLVLDYRALNKLTVKDRSSTPCHTSHGPGTCGEGACVQPARPALGLPPPAGTR